MIVQPAQPPSRAYKPDRLLIDGAALPGGLAVAVFLAILFEVIDGTVKTRREVADKIAAPIIGEIPWLPTHNGSRRQRLRVLLAAASSSVLALAYVATVMFAVK